MAERHLASSEAATAAIASRLAAGLSPGSVVLLTGDLGAGKTAFVRGMAAGLGIDPAEVSSPTFTLVQVYRGAARVLYHVDLYRLEGREADDLGLEELPAEPGAIVAIEWADKLPEWPPGAVLVEIEDLGGEVREITIGRESVGDPSVGSR